MYRPSTLLCGTTSVPPDTVTFVAPSHDAVPQNFSVPLATSTLPVAEIARFVMPNVKPSFASTIRFTSPTKSPVDGGTVFRLP